MDGAYRPAVSAVATGMGTRNPSQAFVERLQRWAAERHPQQHPFELLLRTGLLRAEDLRCWAAAWYYYLSRTPISDALIVAKSTDPHFRRKWLQRIVGADGLEERHAGNACTGTLESFSELAAALGVGLEELHEQVYVPDVVRRTCDEYVEWVRGVELLPAVASCLPECFASGAARERIEAWQRHYSASARQAQAHFEASSRRTTVHARHALHFVTEQATTQGRQEECMDAFRHKCAMLWLLLDAVYIARRRHLQPTLTRKATICPARAASDQRGTSAILLLPERALRLNETAHRLVLRCDGKKTLTRLTREIAHEYGETEETIELDVATFLAELERRRALEFRGTELEWQAPLQV